MNSFEMIVVEKFNFSDGRTVFAVLPEDEQLCILSSSYDLLIDERKVTEIEIEGEMLIENQGKSPYKAISTVDSFKLANLPFESGKWKLRLKQQF